MIGAGLKDEDLENLYKELSQHIIEEPKRDYDVGNLSVDVWFDTKMVWEIKTADLSQSPVYTAANKLTDDERGISLRFPRFIRTRPDKKPEECTSSSEIYRMLKEQEKLTKKINFAEEDFYD
jgi:DNA ligase-1